MSAAYQSEPSSQPRAVPIADRSTVVGLWVILGSLVFLQRLSLGGVPVAFVISYLVLVSLVLLRVVVIDAMFLVFFLVAAAVASLSVIWWPGDASFSSFLYLLAIYALYMLRFRNRAASFAVAQHVFLKCMLIAAVLGIAQFMAQFVLGPEQVFPLEYLPEFIKAQNYNVIIPLTYGSPIVKSNGIFFLEPSFFSQFLAIALLLELLGRQRPVRSGIYLFALLISYSGTGLLTAAIFAPFALMRRINVPLILGCVVIAMIVALSMSVLEFDTLFNRVDEFASPESSGFARFISPFYLIRDFLLPSPDNFLFGMGPGTIEAALTKASFHAYLAHDPTWIKLIFEYGLVGGVAFLSYVICAMYTGARDRLFATVLLLAWLALGGYLLNGMMNVLFVTLGAMHSWSTVRNQERPLTPRRARMAGRAVSRRRYSAPAPGTPAP